MYIAVYNFYISYIKTYSGGVTVAFGAGSGPILLDNIKCVGTEDQLQECAHNGWGIHDCDHSEDVGCACDPPGVNNLLLTC